MLSTFASDYKSVHDSASRPTRTRFPPKRLDLENYHFLKSSQLLGSCLPPPISPPKSSKTVVLDDDKSPLSPALSSRSLSPRPPFDNEITVDSHTTPLEANSFDVTPSSMVATPSAPRLAPDVVVPFGEVSSNDLIPFVDVLLEDDVPLDDRLSLFKLVIRLPLLQLL